VSNGSTPVTIIEDIATLQPGGLAGPGPAGTVDRAVSDVLGWKLKAGDPKGFVAALTRAFTPVDVPGVPGMRTWSWTPRGYALQSDLGALTGAQASIYQRAKQALDSVLPLIDGLEPLVEWADPQAMTASREIVRAQLRQIVDELGAEGGPSVGLVDDLFKDLVGTAPSAGAPSIDAEHVGGQLGTLRDRFGLKRELINTVEEEQDYTNFLVLSDYVTALWLEWGNLRDFFAGTVNPFFGTQLVLITRALNVAAESIREVYAALDAVLIGPAERETLSVPVGTGSAATTVFLGGLLEWADRFLTTDAPALIDSAGREGALSLDPTLKVLSAQVAAFIPTPPSVPPGFPTLYANAIVVSTLTALQGAIDNTRTLIDQLDLGDAEPTFGYPLRPPVLDQSLFIYGVTKVITPGQPKGFVVDGAGLSGAGLVLVQGLQRIPLDMGLVQAQRLEGTVKPQTPPGVWELRLAQAGTDYVLDSIVV